MKKAFVCDCEQLNQKFERRSSIGNFFGFSQKISRVKARGQSCKTFYALRQIYKLFLKLDNMLTLRKYLERILGQYTLMYSQSNSFDRGTISNLGQPET